MQGGGGFALQFGPEPLDQRDCQSARQRRLIGQRGRVETKPGTGLCDFLGEPQGDQPFGGFGHRQRRLEGQQHG